MSDEPDVDAEPGVRDEPDVSEREERDEPEAETVILAPTRRLLRTREQEAAERGAARPPTAAQLVGTLVAAGLLAGGVALGSTQLAVAVGVLGLSLAWGWAPLLDLPSPRGGTAVIVLGSLACVVAAATTLDDPLLRWLPIALAITTIASFAHQLLRGDRRARLVESVAGSVSAVAIVASGATMIPLGSLEHGRRVVLAVMLAVVGAVLVDLLARWKRLRPVIVVSALIVGALAGLGVAHGSPSVPGLPLAVAGAVAAATSAATRRILVILSAAATTAGAVAVAAASTLVVGVLAFLVDLVLVV